MKPDDRKTRVSYLYNENGLFIRLWKYYIGFRYKVISGNKMLDIGFIEFYRRHK